jgi:hypothetical protein
LQTLAQLNCGRLPHCRVSYAAMWMKAKCITDTKDSQEAHRKPVITPLVSVGRHLPKLCTATLHPAKQLELLKNLVQRAIAEHTARE